jgi:hypothetical protein
VANITVPRWKLMKERRELASLSSAAKAVLDWLGDSKDPNACNNCGANIRGADNLRTVIRECEGESGTPEVYDAESD